MRIEAEYADGVLRPKEPLRLRQGEVVKLIVVRTSDPTRWDLDRLTATACDDAELAQAGLECWADELDAEGKR